MNDSQKFISVVIASGLDFETITPEDVFRHVKMDSLAKSLPGELMAMLLEAALASKKMTPTLVLDTLGVDALAEHLPSSLLWACVSEAAMRALGTQAPRQEPEPTPRKTRANKVASASKKAKSVQGTLSQRSKTAATIHTTPVNRDPSKVAKAVATVPRKPNRSAPALFSPEPVAPAVVAPIAIVEEGGIDQLTPKDGLEGRMKTISDTEAAYDEKTNVGFDAAISDEEYKKDEHKKDEPNPYSAEGDEVTAFGPDN